MGEYAREANKLCPTCKEIVIGCYPNKPLQQLCTLIGQRQLAIAPSAQKASKDEEKGEKVQFPGISAKFAYSGDDWKLDNEGIRTFSFISTTRNSLFVSFQVRGSSDGMFSLRIAFATKDNKKIKEYFFSLGIQHVTYSNYAHIMESEDLKKVFRILAEENSIPVDKRQLIEAALKTCDWRDVPELAKIAAEKMNDEAKGEKVKFPGISAKFSYSGGGWKPSSENQVRKFYFTSMNRNSLFDSFHLMGHTDGKLALRIHFDTKNKKKIEEYLLSLGIQYATTDKYVYIEGPENLRTAFRILNEENSIQEDKRRLIEAAFKTCDWRNVPELVAMGKD